jgi:hypothetical protein
MMEAIIVGAGPAGLAVGACLRRAVLVVGFGNSGGEIEIALDL